MRYLNTFRFKRFGLTAMIYFALSATGQSCMAEDSQGVAYFDGLYQTTTSCSCTIDTDDTILETQKVGNTSVSCAEAGTGYVAINVDVLPERYKTGDSKYYYVWSDGDTIQTTTCAKLNCTCGTNVAQNKA